MGQSLRIPTSGLPSSEPSGEFKHEKSGSKVTISWQNSTMHHRIEERGTSADYLIAYAIGFGNVGRSYLIQLDHHFFQSPGSYYTGKAEWGVSPGYESERTLDFTRAITSDCLFCHAGALTSTPNGTELTPISCDRCHGPGENHRNHPVSGSIVNPAKLAVRERNSVCEQCHLEGVTVVPNPGKYWWDFKPGESLEDVETHYVYRTREQQPTIAAVSQAEQLALSACLRGSGGKLWCGTCHDPHGGPTDRKQQMRQICESCHAPTQLAATHDGKQDDCVACHMPRRQASDITHAAVTDHRIMRRPAKAIDVPVSEQLMIAWHAPKAAFAQRNLGLAYFNAAKRDRSTEGFRKSFQILSRLPDALKDGPVEAALGYMLLPGGHTAAAVACFERAVQADPASAEYWLDLGVAQEASADVNSAAKSFRRSIKDDPYDYRPYRALSDLYDGMKQPDEAQAVVNEFLKLVPQSILMRLPQ